MVARKSFTRRFEIAAEVARVVDLAIVDERVTAVPGRHRLMSADEIDDGETAHGKRQAGLAVTEDALIIGPAMALALAHGADPGLLMVSMDAGNAAHSGRP